MFEIVKIPMSVVHLDTIIAIMILNFPHVKEFEIVRENVKWVDVYISSEKKRATNESDPIDTSSSGIKLKSCNVIDSIDIPDLGPELSVYLARSVFENQEIITPTDIDRLLNVGPKTKKHLLQIAQPIANGDYFLLNILPHIFQETQQEVLNKHNGRLEGSFKSSINSSGNDRKYTTIAYIKPLDTNVVRQLGEFIESQTDVGTELTVFVVLKKNENIIYNAFGENLLYFSSNRELYKDFISYVVNFTRLFVFEYGGQCTFQTLMFALLTYELGRKPLRYSTNKNLFSSLTSESGYRNTKEYLLDPTRKLAKTSLLLNNIPVLFDHETHDESGIFSRRYLNEPPVDNVKPMRICVKLSKP